jgi:predicted nuclease with TOPRIM domain
VQIRHEQLLKMSHAAEKLMAENTDLRAKLQPLQALPPSMNAAQERVQSLRHELTRAQDILNSQLRDL